MKDAEIKTTPRGMQVDDEVWAELERLGDQYGSKNAGLRVKLFGETFEAEGQRIARQQSAALLRPARVVGRGLRVKGDGKR